MWAGADMNMAKGVCHREDAGGVPINVDPSIQPTSTMGHTGEFAQAVRRYEQAHAKLASPSRPPTEDVVEISSLARLLSREDQAQGVRQALVEQIKAEIAAGVYDKPEKVDQVLSHLLEDLTQLK